MPSALRRPLIVSLVACSVSFATFGCGGDDEEPAHSADDYAFDLPSGWSDQTEAAPTVASQSGLDPASVRSIAMLDTASPAAAAFLVLTPPGLDDLDLAQFTRAATQEVDRGARERGRQILNQQAPVLGDGPLAPTRPTSISVGGEPAMQFDFEGSQGGVGAKVRSMVVIHDDTRYLLRFISPNFDADVDALGEILDSWRWN